MSLKTQEPLYDAYARVKGIFRQSKAYLVNAKQLVTQPSVPADVVFNIARNPSQVVPQVEAIAAKFGGGVLAAYAREQENDPTYDVVADFTAWKNSLFAIRDHILTTFPKDANGFLLFLTFNADGSTATRNFTAAQCAQLASLIDAAILTLE